MPLLLVAPGVLLVGLFLLAWTQTHQAVVKSHAESGGYWAAIKAQFSLGGNSLIRMFVALANFAISRFAYTYIVHVTRFFTGLNLLVRADAKAQTAIIEQTADAAERLRGVVVPREIHKAVSPVRATARAALREGQKADHKATSVGNDLARYKARTQPQIRHATHAVDVTLPRDIAGVRRREDALSRDLGKLRERTKALEDGAVDTWDWLRSHPLSSVTAVFTGAVAIALSRLGYGFLRCRSWRNLGRSLTCNDANILQDLLALATGILASQISLEEFIRAAQAVETEAVDALHSFITE